MVPISEIAQTVHLEADGVWAANSLAQISYPEDGNSLCYAIEDDSFWFHHRNACILEAVHGFAPRGAFFDIGGGNGYVASALQTSGQEVVLVEPGHAGVQNAVRRGVRQIVRGTLDDAGFLPGTIPAMGMFDVLEHIEDDEAFLRNAHHYLADAGRIYLTVPAFQWLWSNEDDAAGHFRRYTRKSLSRVLVRAGFDIDFATYFFHFLPGPAYLLRALPYRFGLRSGAPTVESARAEHTLGPASNAILGPMMDWELRRIRRGSTLPFGGSCLAVASKHST